MDKKEIISFFDSLAPSWDKGEDGKNAVIDEILDKASITSGCRVLDIACGTGVLFPYYIDRGAIVTGVDISSGMVEIAREKFPNVDIICADAENTEFSGAYDCVMIYNAFPHFICPEKLIENLSRALKKGGRLSVAHGMSREKIEKCHFGISDKVYRPLCTKEETARLLSGIFDVDVMISDDRMYMVSGIKKA